MLSEEEEEEDEESELDTTPGNNNNSEGRARKVAAGAQDYGVVGEHLTSAASHAKH